MKTVAQTVIEADRFYTIAAHTGNVIQAVEASKDGGTVRLGKYDHKPEQEWSFVRVGEGVDRIRNRAGLGKLPQSTRSSKEALLQAYMDERRMELAFEGQRWYDLCRLNKVEEVMNAVYAKDSGRHAQENLFNENSYLLAIPQGAIDQNENLIQNPGY